LLASSLRDQPALQHGSAPQAGSAQQLVQLSPQHSLLRRLRMPARARPRRRGSQQLGWAAAQAGSAALQAGSDAHASAAQPGSAEQVGPQSQLVRPRRPRPAAEADSAATRPARTNTKTIEKIVEKRFIEKLLGGNRTEPQSFEE
jgi:hypothetical protein